jgi:Ran GTPase-activating protein (RanGAP) involved in mRNA processing and transport
MIRDFFVLDVGSQPRALLSHHCWADFVDALIAVGRRDGGRLTHEPIMRVSNDVSQKGVRLSESTAIARSAGRRFLRLGDVDPLLSDEITLALSTELTGVPLCRRMVEELLLSAAGKQHGVSSSAAADTLVANAELDAWWSTALSSSRSVSSAALSSFAEWRDEDVVTEYMKLVVRDLEVHPMNATSFYSEPQQHHHSAFVSIHLHDCSVAALMMPADRRTTQAPPLDAAAKIRNRCLVAEAVRASSATLSSFVLSFSTSSSELPQHTSSPLFSGWLCGCFVPEPPANHGVVTPILFSAMQRLSLVNVFLGDKGAAAFVRSVLPSTPLLARLELTNVCCGEFGAASLGEMLASESCSSLCRHLRVLELAGNPIGRVGVVKVLNGLVLGCRMLAAAAGAPAGATLPSPRQSPLGKVPLSSPTRRRLQPETSASARRRDPIASMSATPAPELYLQSLDLSSTCIGENPPEELFVLLEHFTSSSLRSLRLGHNHIGLCGARRFSEHMSAAALSASGAGRGLEVLHIQGNTLADGGVVALSKALLAMASTLRVLNLADNRIEPIGGAALAAVLQRGMQQLESLNLEGNHKLGEASWAAIGAAMSTGLYPRLGELELASSGLELNSSSSLSQSSSSHIAVAAKQMTSDFLTTTTQRPQGGANSAVMLVTQGLRAVAAQIGRLTLDDVSLADRGAVALLSTAVRRMRGLQMLSLKRCDLRDDHILVLFETGLAHTAGSVQQLWFDGNHFSAVGVRHIASQLESMARRLCLISLADVPIGGQGGAELGSCVDIAAGLEVLNATRCRLGDLAMAALGEGLAFLPRLKELWLEQNSVSSLGLVDLLSLPPATEITVQQSPLSLPAASKAFVQCRWMGRHLRVLCVKHNPIGDVGLMSLSDCLASCVNLVHLDVSCVGFEEAGLKSLCSLLQRWTDDAQQNSNDPTALQSQSSHPLAFLDVSGNASRASPDQAFVMLLTSVLYPGHAAAAGGADSSGLRRVPCSPPPPPPPLSPSPFSSLVFLNAAMGSAMLAAPFSQKRSHAQNLRDQFCHARRFVVHQCLPVFASAPL